MVSRVLFGIVEVVRGPLGYVFTNIVGVFFYYLAGWGVLRQGVFCFLVFLRGYVLYVKGGAIGASSCYGQWCGVSVFV